MGSSATATDDHWMRRTAILAAFSVIIVASIVAVVASQANPPPGTMLTGTTWQWTGITRASGVSPSAVPDPAKYTLDFGTDLAFRASGDCSSVAGTYRRVLAGRTGSEWTGLRLRLDPPEAAACGAESLSDEYLRVLDTATRYRIVDHGLTIQLSDGGVATFRSIDAGASQPPGG